MQLARLAALCATICVAITGSDAPAAVPADPSAIEAIVARQEALSNVVVHYEETQTWKLPPRVLERITGGASSTELAERLGKGQKGARAYLRQGTSTVEATYKHLGRRNYYEENIVAQPDAVQKGLAPPWPSPKVIAVGSERVEERWGDSGIIKDALQLPVDNMLEVGLGLRTKRNDNWLTGDDWRKCVIELNDANKLVLKRQTESTSRKIEWKDVWEFDPQLDYALIKYESFRRIDGEGDFTLSMVVENSDFREGDAGLTLPYHMDGRVMHLFPREEDAPVTTRQMELNVSFYQVGQLKGSDDELSITWPNKFDIIDSRSGRVYRIDKGPDRLTDEMIRTIDEARTLPEVSRQRSWSIIVIGNVILAIAAIVYVFYRRHRHPKSV